MSEIKKGYRTTNVGMEPLEDMIKYTLYSGYVKNKERPLSLLIIANSARGKSSTIMSFDTLGIKVINDPTAFGIERFLNKMNLEERRKLNHFIIPDLERVASRSKNVKKELLALMRIIEEEGLLSKHTGKINIDFEEPFQAGFICATTPEDFGDRRSIFRSISWMTRRFVFTYEFSDKMIASVMSFIEKEEHRARKLNQFSIYKEVEVVLPKEILGPIDFFAQRLADRYDKFCTQPPKDMDTGAPRSFGLREKENLMTLLKAIALYDGRKRVERQDIRKLVALWKYMNFDFRRFEYYDEDLPEY